MSLVLRSQDPQFTQFYAAPTYLNPAFAGSSEQSRLTANYRNQWPSIPGAFVTYRASYDRFIDNISSGVGISAMHDRAGTGAMRATSVDLQYNFEFQIFKDVYVRPAMEFGFTNSSINFNDLTFGDQLVRDGAESSVEPYMPPVVNYFDFGSGGLIYGRNFWAGASVYHLNEPNQSLLGGASRLNKKLSVHGGYRFNLKSMRNKQGVDLLAAFQYKKQGEFEQLDLGLYVETSPMVLGIWYRSIPFKQTVEGYFNHDAISILAGFHAGPYKIGYSYDFTVSQLSIGNTGGSHEISIIYEWANDKSNFTRRRIVPCAKF
jgi:type IX secretion system PorP/SprF family membrane protein